MSEIDINQVLQQMRVLTAQAQHNPIPTSSAVDDQSVSFATLLNNTIHEVNDVMMKSGKLSEEFSKGNPDTDITQVMIALQKASVSFQAMTQVRNKLVTAYQEVMKMPV